LNQSNKNTGERAGIQTVSSSETTISSDQIEGRALYIAGLAKYEAEQYDKAIALFTEALKRATGSGIRLGLGTCLSCVGIASISRAVSAKLSRITIKP